MMRTVKVYCLSNLQFYNTVLLISHHPVHCTPRTYLCCDWKLVPLHHLHPFGPHHHHTPAPPLATANLFTVHSAEVYSASGFPSFAPRWIWSKVVEQWFGCPGVSNGRQHITCRGRQTPYWCHHTRTKGYESTYYLHNWSFPMKSENSLMLLSFSIISDSRLKVMSLE